MPRMTKAMRLAIEAKAQEEADMKAGETTGETAGENPGETRARTLGCVTEEWAMVDASHADVCDAVRALRRIQRRPGVGLKLYHCQAALKARWGVDIANVGERARRA